MGKALWEAQRRPLQTPWKWETNCAQDRGFSQQLRALPWSVLCRYSVAHPAGTFICIYSSWLTCHSPSSNVSIQGTIIYRTIGSRAPYRLSCQVTSPPLLVTSRDENKLPGCPFLQTQLEGGKVSPSIHLSSLLLVLSAPWVTRHIQDCLSDLYR